ncbi:hypothetical protein PVAP13_2KG277355 [Panicum virgatum]|uniref:Uncharacterized protein n=2 Tax=Panicum virgatum TaxID=38727 RepID=A0A8T0W2M6_PANVG|nr:hypothetical protein PVAP13_2KG277355 [Panicum virgatum]
MQNTAPGLGAPGVRHCGPCKEDGTRISLTSDAPCVGRHSWRRIGPRPSLAGVAADRLPPEGRHTVLTLGGGVAAHVCRRTLIRPVDRGPAWCSMTRTASAAAGGWGSPSGCGTASLNATVRFTFRNICTFFGVHSRRSRHALLHPSRSPPAMITVPILPWIDLLIGYSCCGLVLISQLWGDHGRAASSSAIAALGRAALIKNIVQDLNLRLMLYSIYRLRIFSEKKAQFSGHCLSGQQGVNTPKEEKERN